MKKVGNYEITKAPEGSHMIGYVIVNMKSGKMSGPFASTQDARQVAARLNRETK